MGFKTNKFLNEYRDNLINYFLTFNDPYSWNVTGTGSATNSTLQSFEGDRALRLVNNDALSDLTATPLGSETNVTINRSGDYILSCRVYVPDATELDEVVTATITYFIDGAGATDMDMVVRDEDGYLIKDRWVTFFQTIPSLNAGEVLSFNFKIKSIADDKPTVTVFFDGLKLEENKIGVPTSYTRPKTQGIQVFGSYNYQDSGSTSVPLTLANTWYQIGNDAGGVLTSTEGGYSDITPYDETTGEFILEGLDIHDEVEVRFDLFTTTTTTNVKVSFRINIANGIAFLDLGSSEYDTAVTAEQVTAYIPIGVLTELAKTDGFTLEASSDKTGSTITVSGWYMKVNKRIV